MRRAARRRAGRLSALLLVAVLTGCSGGGYEPAGPFRPLPEGAPPEVGPPSEAPAPVPRDPAAPGSGASSGDPNVVADDLDVPTGLVVLPDGSAIVGERETGRLLQVFPDRSPARELMTIAGIDTGGDGGLLGLALSPTYPEDGLLYAYLSTARDNRVVRFPIGGAPNPVVTGIPRGQIHNGGGLVFGTDGHLLIGTGDTGDPALAADPASLAGKVLRVDVFGRPVGRTPVFSRGHADVTALCLRGEADVLATDDAAEGPDAVRTVVRGGDASQVPPVVEFPEQVGGPAGCAALDQVVFVSALDGERLYVVQTDRSGVADEEPAEVLEGNYGRLRTLVLDAEGGLWITTSNRDGNGEPRDRDDKVLRIVPPTSSGNSPL